MDGVREILILTPSMDGADGISEVSRQVVAAVGRLTPEIDVEVWALAGGQSTDDRTAHVRFRSAGGSRTRVSAWALARARTASDGLLVLVLHVHLAPLALPMELRGARLAFFLYGIEVWRRLRSRERRVLDRASVLLAISEWTAARFREANPEYRHANVRICPPAVSRQAVAEPAGREGYALIVGRLSADERYKGHDALIDVWPAVRAEVPDAELLIVGDGDDRPRLEAAVRERGLADAIRFAGRTTAGALEGLYRNAAFFVMPSVGEGFGIVFLEAMRAGKACIAGPGASAEIVRDGVTGLIVNPQARGDLTRAIARMFKEPATRRAMGAAGADRVRSCYEQEQFT
ncbi:MAG TPA: glycosyltransferase, partial [Vicinamibacterales bacterium]|nr:glycosyltransferase [Vicinamibacterales bacterium]